MKKMKNEAVLTIRMDEKEKAKLEAEAHAQGLTLSAYVRRILIGLESRRKGKLV